MIDKTVRQDILKALKGLGHETQEREVYIFIIAYNRYKVFYKRRYIGVWDSQRKTFVD